ncbi:hypothetical protein D3C71_1198860 [compost metagenome]
MRFPSAAWIFCFERFGDRQEIRHRLRFRQVQFLQPVRTYIEELILVRIIRTWNPHEFTVESGGLQLHSAIHRQEFLRLIRRILVIYVRDIHNHIRFGQLFQLCSINLHEVRKIIGGDGHLHFFLELNVIGGHPFIRELHTDIFLIRIIDRVLLKAFALIEFEILIACRNC